MWGLPQKKNARRAYKIRLCGHLRRYKKIVKKTYIIYYKFDLNKENSNGLGLYIVSNILNNYNIEYKALQDEEFFIFKIEIFS